MVEGIETAGQVAQISALDGVFGQQYDLSRPLSVAAVDRLPSAGLEHRSATLAG